MNTNRGTGNGVRRSANHDNLRGQVELLALQSISRAAEEIAGAPGFAELRRAMEATHAGVSTAALVGELMADAINNLNLQEVGHG